MKALSEVKRVYIRRFSVVPLASTDTDGTVRDISYVSIRAELTEPGLNYGDADTWLLTASYESEPTAARACYDMAFADIELGRYVKAWDMETFTHEVVKFISRLNSFHLPLIAGIYALGTEDVCQSDLMSILFCGYSVDHY